MNVMNQAWLWEELLGTDNFVKTMPGF